MRSLTWLAAAALVWGAGDACHPSVAIAGPPAGLASCRARAREEGKLVLVEFGAEWCTGCKAFARDAGSRPELAEALSRVVLCRLDAEKGEGVALSKQFRIAALPTFVLADSLGRAVDRWIGYTQAASFCAQLAAALADPVPIDSKQARFDAHPTAPRAMQLAAIRIAESNLREGISLYRRARALDPQSGSGCAAEIFATMETGYRGGVPGFTADSLRAAADLVLKSVPRDPALLLHVAATMREAASRSGHPEAAAPYLAAAVDATAGVVDPALREERRALLADHALYVEHDVRRAARLQRDAMPDGWDSDPARLNEYVWWCLQHDVNLEDAEQLARRGVEIASPGRERAQLLDTLAEVRARRGDPREAASLAQRAMRELPESTYYPRQYERFCKAAGIAQ